MAIDAAVVKRVAELANLELTESEVVYFQKHLSSILDYVAQLSELPEVGREELGVSDSLGRERRDSVRPSLPPAVAVANAAVISGTAFKVPRIID